MAAKAQRKVSKATLVRLKALRRKHKLGEFKTKRRTARRGTRRSARRSARAKTPVSFGDAPGQFGAFGGFGFHKVSKTGFVSSAMASPYGSGSGGSTSTSGSGG